MDFYNLAKEIVLEHGLPVYAAARDKSPLYLPDVQVHGIKDATTDLGKLAALGDAFPDANAGLPMGIRLPSGLYLGAVDGDRHQADTDGIASLAPFNLDGLRGPKSETPQHGNHWLVQTSAPIPTVTRFLPGADFIGSVGNGILIPLSETVHGRYRWLRDLSAPIPELSDELRAVILQAKATQTATDTDETPGTTFSSVIRRFERAERGTRNDALNRAAFQCGRLVQAGLVDEQEAKDTLQDVAASLGLYSDEARKTDRTLERAFDAGLVARGAVHAGSAERVQALHRIQDAARAPWPGRTGVSDCKVYLGLCTKALACGSNDVDVSVRAAAELGNVGKSTAARSVKRLINAGLVQCTAIAGEPLQDVDGTLIIAARSYRLPDAPELSISGTHNRLSGDDGAQPTGESVPQSAAGERQVGAEDEKSAGGAVAGTDMCPTFAQIAAHDAFSWGGLGAVSGQLYSALLDDGPLTVSELVTRTGRSRSGVYVVLERLSNLVDESTGEVFPPLVSKVDGRRWQANSVDLDELAVFLHVDGRQAKRKAQHEHEREMYRKLCERDTAKQRIKQPAPTAGTHQGKRGDSQREQATAAHEKAFVSPRQKRLDALREVQAQIARAEQQLGLVRGKAPRTRHQVGAAAYGRMVGAKRNTTGGNDVAGTGRAPVADDRTVSGAAAVGPAILGWIPNGTERVH